MSESFTAFSRNGAIQPLAAATVSLLSVEYSYGYGVYETLKLRGGIVYFIDQHLERLQHSASVLGIPLPFSAAEMKQQIMELVAALQVDACNLKILLIGSARETAPADLSIFATAPLFPDRKLYTHGARLTTYEYERLFPTAKTLNMLPSYIAYKKVLAAGCYDALLVGHDGVMLEGTRTNFCVVRGQTIFRAPAERVLGGVTFLTLAATAAQAGFEIQEMAISLADLPKYDGAFITSTSTKIMPVQQVGDFTFAAIAPQIKQLMKAYDAFLEKSGGVFKK